MSCKVIVNGASGRSGSLVVKLIQASSELILHGAIVSSRSKLLGQSIAEPGGVKYSDNFLESAKGGDLCIDFSEPQGALKAVDGCAELGIPILVATTGLSEDQIAHIRSQAKRIPILLTSNTSLGVAALRSLAVHAQKILGDKYQVEILDIHHRFKKDAPSGTAKTLAEDLAQLGNSPIVEDRSGKIGARGDGEIGVSALRGGDVVGEHTIYFFGEGERIEITHRATNREIFARGAISLASKLIEKTPGFYTVQDVIGHF